MRRLNPKIVALIAALLALLLVAYVFSGGKRQNPEKLTYDQVAGRSASDPQERCGAQATYDLIKRELFRRAAQLRGSNQAEFENLATYSVARVSSPRLTSHDENVGRISCSGSLTLDLPPGIAVVGGRRSLTADFGYALQPTADGTGEVLTLSNADALVTPLATLNRAGGPAATPAPPAAVDQGAGPVLPVASTPAPPRSATPPPAASTPPRPTRESAPAQPRVAAPPPPRAPASPSFNCRNARTRGELAVCNDGALASLDRQMASQFYGAMSQGNAAQRALLQRTRGRFLSYRDSCRSDACVAGAYRDRMREISDIMAGRWRVP